MSGNPFERFNLDPEEGPAGITERLRDLAEDADDPDARDELRAAWEQLTRHPRERVRLALGAHPESRAPLPARAGAPRGLTALPGVAAPRLPAPTDFLDPPSVEEALVAWLRRAGTPPPPLDQALAPPLDQDPVLGGHPNSESKS
jgi:hypothetical protein